MINLVDPDEHFLHCSAHSLISDMPLTIVTEAIDIDSKLVVGSCNGLICLFLGDFPKFDLFLWNPSTRISERLPQTNVEKDNIDWGAFGLCYSKAKDDYVVLSVLINGGELGSHVHVYSSRTRSWKRIGDFDFGHPVYDRVCRFVAGKFHLPTCPEGGYSFEDPGPPIMFDIVSFDVEKEACGVIKHPNYGDGAVVGLSLEELGGRLCVLCSKESHADLWVMNEYGVVKSWTVMISIPYFANSRRLYSKPLVMLQSGKILLVKQLDYVTFRDLNKRHFVVYDPIENSLRVPETCNFGNFDEADVYVESLVWPTLELDE